MKDDNDTSICIGCFWLVQPYGYYPIVCFRDKVVDMYHDKKRCKHFKPEVIVEEQPQQPWEVFYNN